MDFSKYLKQDQPDKGQSFNLEKKCLECGKPIEEKEYPFHYHGFCSQECKDKYIVG